MKDGAFEKHKKIGGRREISDEKKKIEGEGT